MQTHMKTRPTAGAAASESLPILFFKPGCPWCTEVATFLDEHGISHRLIDITRDSAGRARMERISRQAKAPTLDWHGEILADFGLDELVPFLRSKNIKLEDS